MTVKLNHTIVHSRDPRAAADFFSGLFGLPAPVPFGPFLVVELDNDVSLDFHSLDEHEMQVIASQHYAFLVNDDEWDAILARVVARGLDYWADPGKGQAGQVNDHDGGKGVYFEDPDGHFLEIITRPYGSGG